ncbi:hypothetical protein [Mitsuaria sp. GD03876]|uniref:hypothetical protein n=1 Tax=Mitsuaria sp. GD03876 TaxID=2975399 RepID=UPI00244B18BD|nr:hypothetical protein [Mitsuaria sp. GD03876]MDH0864946.1 hypothetical protein [Mitsuaria sp. GD03876]
MPAEPVDPEDPADAGRSPSTSPDGVETLRGRVVRDRVATGSKSEHVAMLLALPDDTRVPLRRAGGNPFHDPVLAALEGQVLIVEGERRASYFLVRRHTVCDDDAGSSG